MVIILFSFRKVTHLYLEAGICYSCVMISDESDIKTLGSILLAELNKKEKYLKDEKRRKVLSLIAKGVALGVILAAPRSGSVLKGVVRDLSDWDEWKIFNQRYLRRSLNNLARNELIEIKRHGDGATVKITRKGETQIYKWAIENFEIPRSNKWDGLWRLVIYDVLDGKKGTRDRLRQVLENAGFYRLQESIYLQAFSCEREVEFLRSYLGVRAEVRLILAKSIENDEVFKKYFGI